MSRSVPARRRCGIGGVKSGTVGITSLVAGPPERHRPRRQGAYRVPFAFLVHPRADVSRDLGRVWSPLHAVPSAGRSSGDCATCRSRRSRWARCPGADEEAWRAGSSWSRSGRGRCSRGPALGARQGRERRRPRGSLGADVVGLGALTAPVTGGGRLLRQREGVTVTNGNAFTAAADRAGRPAAGRRDGPTARGGARGDRQRRVLRRAAAGRRRSTSASSPSSPVVATASPTSLGACERPGPGCRCTRPTRSTPCGTRTSSSSSRRRPRPCCAPSTSSPARWSSTTPSRATPTPRSR